jgi:hypothetical protein
VKTLPRGRTILHEKLSKNAAGAAGLNGLSISIYGLAASGARAAMHERGAPGARGRAGCEKTGASPAIV